MKTTENNTKINTTEQYKCPNCGGNVEFNSNVQKMKCPFCDSEFDMEVLKEISDIESTEEATINWGTYGDEKGEGDWAEGEKEQVSRYICQSCGGEVITDITTVASQCPYCDSPMVIASELKDTFKPDLVIPFKLDKEAAKKGLNEFLKGKRLLPKCFKDENHIEEIKGIYVPFWLYNCSADGKVIFDATNSRYWSDGDYDYTETDHYKIHREGEVAFAKIPADGSQKMDDTLMEAIEPYDYSQAVDFQTAYLAGYLAEKYDVKAEENQGRINERITESLVCQFRDTIRNYDTCTVNHKNVTSKNGKIEYAALPVWLLNTKYKGKSYVFAMNGQTGKFVGNLPIDKMKATLHFTGAFAISAVVLTILFGLFA